MKKMICSLFLIVILFCFSSLVLAREFPDVDANHWAHQYISELSDKGVINGYTDGTFQPSGTVTRGEFLKLVLSACIPDDLDPDELGSAFDHWTGTYVWLAEKFFIIDMGEYTLENINEPITRIEMVRLISNADMTLKEHSANQSKELEFVDLVEVETKDLYLLKHAYSSGYITGYEDNTFKPSRTMSRAEAATMIWRLSKDEQ